MGGLWSAAPGEGAALVGGLLVCGRCGYRMSVHYDGPDKRLNYLCERRQVDYGGPPCKCRLTDVE